MKFSEQSKQAADIMRVGDIELIILESIYGKGHYKTNFLADPLTVLVEHFFNIVASRDTFENLAWWKAAFHDGISNDEKAYTLESQYRHIKFFFFIKYFSVIESQFRVLCRKIDPSVLNKGRADFKKIYDFIFKQFDLGEHDYQLFDFCRLNRNVIHNRGFHTSPTQIIMYREKEYSFVEWEEVLIISAEIQFVVHRDLLQTILNIKNSKLFRDLPI